MAMFCDDDDDVIWLWLSFCLLFCGVAKKWCVLLAVHYLLLLILPCSHIKKIYNAYFVTSSIFVNSSTYKYVRTSWFGLSSRLVEFMGFDKAAHLHIANYYLSSACRVRRHYIMRWWYCPPILKTHEVVQHWFGNSSLRKKSVSPCLVHIFRKKYFIMMSASTANLFNVAVNNTTPQLSQENVQHNQLYYNAQECMHKYEWLLLFYRWGLL